MPRRVRATLAACFLATVTGQSQPLPPAGGATTARARVPVSFEPNHGQFDPSVRFVSRGRGYNVFLTDAEAVLVLRHGTGSTSGDANVIRLSFEGSHAQAPTGERQQPGTVNYLIGSDPAKWRTGIATFERVRYDALYPGIDLLFYGNSSAHEYDLVVAPGANPEQIALKVSGADHVTLDQSGHLQLTARESTVTLRAPRVYQMVNGERHDVGARYLLARDHSVRFALDSYDRGREVVIDPEIVYGTFLGGSSDLIDQVSAVDVDANGSPYIVGFSETADFPTERPFQGQRNGSADAVITKLTPDGLQRVYATYLGGSGYETGDAVAVRDDGVAYVLGSTNSDDFPARGDAFQRRYAGNGDVFVVEVKADGTGLANATYLGGGDTETPAGLLLAARKDTTLEDGTTVPANPVGDRLFVYGSTRSPNFPTRRASRTTRTGERDGFVTVFDRQSLQPIYSAYAGAEGYNQAEGLSVNYATGDFYLFVQRPQSDDEPFIVRYKPTSFITARHGDNQPAVDIVDGFQDLQLGLAARFSSVRATPTAVRQLLKGFYLANCGLEAEGERQIVRFCQSVLRSDGSRVRSTTALPLTVRPAPQADARPAGAMLAVFPGCLPVAPATTCNERAAVVIFDENVEILGFKNFGGPRASREFTPLRATSDGMGRLHLIGRTSDFSLPVVNPVQAANRGSSEGFVATLDGTGAMIFLSYLGGSSSDDLTDIAVDRDGNRWVVGSTLSSDFPVTRSGAQTERRGRIDGFVVKITP